LHTMLKRAAALEEPAFGLELHLGRAPIGGWFGESRTGLPGPVRVTEPSGSGAGAERSFGAVGGPDGHRAAKGRCSKRLRMVWAGAGQVFGRTSGTSGGASSDVDVAGLRKPSGQGGLDTDGFRNGGPPGVRFQEADGSTDRRPSGLGFRKPNLRDRRLRTERSKPEPLRGDRWRCGKVERLMPSGVARATKQGRRVKGSSDAAAIGQSGFGHGSP
jgi:hypothetical protein